MSYKGLKDSFNQLKLNDDNESSLVDVSCLNDDCLMHIFQYLSFKEKIDVENVCKRWNAVSKQTWNHVKSLSIDDDFEEKYFQLGTIIHNTNFLMNVLYRSSNYLNELCINGVECTIDFIQIIKKSADFLTNLTKLDLWDVNADDNILKLIFESNENLKSVCLRFLDFTGSCLLSLNPNLIEELTLDTCQIHSKEILSDFVCHLKNLKLIDTNFDHEIIIDALNFCNVESIEEFLIEEACYFIEPDKLHAFLKKQKQLRKLKLELITEDLVNNLSVDKIEEIENIDFDREFFINSVHLFKNLKVLLCSMSEFTDKHAFAISKCNNLKHLGLDIKTYNSTTKSYSVFENLQDLEYLMIHFYNLGCCRFLIEFSKCKNLNKIDLSHMNFDEKSIDKLDSLTNLETFSLCHSNITNKILADVVSKSPKLNYITLRYCRNINNEFISLASNIKKNRNDSNVLTIEYDETNISKDDLHEISSLIFLKNT